jgi:hypothetical protein
MGVAPKAKRQNLQRQPYTPKTPKTPMPKPWADHACFAALDWARHHHDVVVVLRDGSIAAEFRFPHTADGWQQMRERLREFDPEMPIAIETNQGAAIEQLLQTPLTLYPINPHAASAYRHRKRPGGSSSDRIDAWTMADALRTDGQAWKPLLREDPLTGELRLLCRDEVALIEQRTALLHQLHEALLAYYPAAMDAFEGDFSTPGSWAFLERFPTPKRLQNAGKRQWEKFLHAHKLWRPQTAPRRLEIFAQADRMTASEATTAAKSLLALSLMRMLRTLQEQLDLYRQRIEELFAQHPDHDLFGSLPGAGPKLAPRLLSEIGSERARFEDPSALQMFGGSAPITEQSGKSSYTRMRHHCQKAFRHTLHLFSEQTLIRSVWAKAYYDAQRQKRRSHADALRRLAHRWLKIIWKMWQTRTPYNEAFHLQNQIKHGSWLLTLHPPKPAQN